MPFARPTLDELIDRTDAELAARLGTDPLLRSSVLAVLSRVVAGGAHLLHGHLAWVADQILPDTADPENMERWGSIVGIFRKAATKASGPVDFTGTEGADVPTGTLVSRADGVEFATTETVVIAGGTAQANVEAVKGAAAGNTAATTGLELVNPVAGIDSDATVATGGLSGGADRESNEDLLDRILQRLRQPPQGGARADYELWSLEVPGVTRAFGLPEHFGLGTVGVTFLVDDDPAGPIPDQAKVDEVQAYIDDPTRRPVTADAQVFAPTPVPLDPTIQLTPDTPAVRSAVEASLEDMLFARATPGGTVRLSWIHEAISTAAGEEDHVLVSPVADVTTQAGEIVTLGTITWQ